MAGGLWRFDLELAWKRILRQPARAITGSWAIAAAVLAVLFVLALGDGLHAYLSERLRLFTPALWVEAPPDGSDSGDAERVLRSIDGVRAVSPHVQGVVLAAKGAKALPARLEGYDLSLLAEVTPVSSRHLIGRLPAAADEAAVGAELARSLGAGLGEPIRLVGDVSQSAEVRVVGLFDAGFSAVDAELVWIDAASALAALGAGARRGFAVGVRPGSDLETLRLEIQSRLSAWTVPWYEENQGLLEALAVERQVMFWISLSALVTAAFAGASVALLRVFERRFELAVLQAMGAPPASLLRTVLFETAGGAALGALAGTALSRIALWALERHPVPLPARFGLSSLPVEPAWWHVGVAALLATLSTAVAALIPAVRAYRTDPARALRSR